VATGLSTVGRSVGACGILVLIPYDFVPGHKIEVLLPLALCALGRAEPHHSGRMS